MLTYQEIRPGEALADYIYCYWIFSYQPQDHQEILEHSIPPDGCFSLAFPYHPLAPGLGISLLGPQTSIFRLPVFPGSHCLGVRFMPGVGKALFQISPKEWVNQNLEAEDLIGELDTTAIFARWPKEEAASSWLDPIFMEWVAEKRGQLD